MEQLQQNLTTKEKLLQLEKEYPIVEEKTFKYEKLENETEVNKDIFYDFLGLTKEEFVSKQKTPYAIKFLFDEKIEEIEKQLEALLSEISPENLEDKIIKTSLEYRLNWIKLIKVGFVNELQKAFPQEDLSSLENNLGEIDNINTILYGEKTIDNPELIKRIYYKVLLAYTDNTSKLSSLEKASINKFLKKVKKHLPRGGNNMSNNGLKEQLEKEIYLTKEKNEILNKELTSEQTKKVFELVFKIYSQIYGTKFGEEVIVEDNNTVSVNWGKLKLKEQNYSIYHIIKLIAHEVEKHMTKNYNMRQNIGKIQQPGYTEMEESTAVIFENIVMENKIPYLSPIVPLTTAGEVFDNPSDLQLFISGYLKLIGKYKENDEEKRFLRLKQFYAFDKAGVHRKGILYSTGIQKVLEFVEKGETQKLFVGAFNYDTLKTEDVENYFSKIIKPILLAEVLKYIIDNNLIDEIINGKPIATKKLVKHLKGKYKQFGIDIMEEIRNLNKTKRGNKVENNNQSTRTSLVEILKTFKK